jgi:hypothetical protein
MSIGIVKMKNVLAKEQKNFKKSKTVGIVMAVLIMITRIAGCGKI